jgi:hypothetical protein
MEKPIRLAVVTRRDARANTWSWAKNAVAAGYFSAQDGETLDAAVVVMKDPNQPGCLGVITYRDPGGKYPSLDEWLDFVLWEE